MIAKTYGIYDSVQAEYIQTFTASNDADARRTAAQIVRTPNFDDVKYKDRSIHHLFDLDSATGAVINNQIIQVFNFSTAIEERNQEKLENMVKEKLLTKDFVDELKDIVIASIKGEIKNDTTSDSKETSHY